MDQQTRVPQENYASALVLLGLPQQLEGAYLTHVEIDQGLVTGTYTWIKRIQMGGE